MCLYDRKSLGIVYISASVPVSMNVCASTHSGGPTHLPSSPPEQDWILFAGLGGSGRLHLSQGCIKLEMDEVADKTCAGITCVFQSLHSHPPNAPHANGTFHPPKDAVLLPRET